MWPLHYFENRVLFNVCLQSDGAGSRMSEVVGVRFKKAAGSLYLLNVFKYKLLKIVAYCVCLALRYDRVDELIWVKTNQLQRIIRTGRTGHWFNHGKEHCLVSQTKMASAFFVTHLNSRCFLVLYQIIAVRTIVIRLEAQQSTRCIWPRSVSTF